MRSHAAAPPAQTVCIGSRRWRKNNNWSAISFNAEDEFVFIVLTACELVQTSEGQAGAAAAAAGDQRSCDSESVRVHDTWGFSPLVCVCVCVW